MALERTLWRVAILCAALLLSAPATGRTSWTFLAGSESHSALGGMVHSAGWDWIAPIAGIIAMIALALGQWLLPGIIRPSICAALTALCFLAAAAAAFGHWLDLRSGALEIGGASIHPAPAVGYFAGIAAVGTVAAFLLLWAWLNTRSLRPA